MSTRVTRSGRTVGEGSRPERGRKQRTENNGPKTTDREDRTEKSGPKATDRKDRDGKRNAGALSRARSPYSQRSSRPALLGPSFSARPSRPVLLGPSFSARPSRPVLLGFSPSLLIRQHNPSERTAPRRIVRRYDRPPVPPRDREARDVDDHIGRSIRGRRAGGDGAELVGAWRD